MSFIRTVKGSSLSEGMGLCAQEEDRKEGTFIIENAICRCVSCSLGEINTNGGS